ncbi:DsbA family protein [Kribbella sp. NBC_00709]
MTRRTRERRTRDDPVKALRRAFWFDSRPIGHRQVILEVAADVDSVDAAALTAALDDGRARSAVMADHTIAVTDVVQGSPHLFLPDGTSVHNPGIDVHWEGPWASGYPIAQATDPDWPDRLLNLVTG